MKLVNLSRRIQVLVAALATVGASALATAPAHASVINAAGCTSGPISQPFAPWGDTNDYVLAPGGGFAGDSTSWSLSGGAHVSPGGDPYNAAGVGSPSSLSLPAGASAQSPFACVDLSRPTVRFFGRNTGALSAVLVQMVIKVPLAGQVALPVGTLALDGSWQPSAAMLTNSGVVSGEMALRFTALTGSSQIDDVFVDPRMRRLIVRYESPARSTARWTSPASRATRRPSSVVTSKRPSVSRPAAIPWPAPQRIDRPASASRPRKASSTAGDG